MRRLTFIAATAFLSSVITTATAQTYPATASQVYFSQNSGPAGMIDVYMNGRLMAANVFPGTISFFPMELAPGTYTFVVTRHGAPVGTANLISKDMTVAAAGHRYVLIFSPDNYLERTHKFDMKAYNPEQ